MYRRPWTRGFILKLDLEKAYVKVEYHFLDLIMELKGFDVDVGLKVVSITNFFDNDRSRRKILASRGLILRSSKKP